MKELRLLHFVTRRYVDLTTPCHTTIIIQAYFEWKREESISGNARNIRKCHMNASYCIKDIHPTITIRIQTPFVVTTYVCITVLTNFPI